MKRLYYSAAVILTTGMSLYSCNESFLEKPALGSLSEVVLNSPEGVRALLIGTYGVLDGSNLGINAWEVAPSNWIYGDIAGGDAHKGSDGGDQPAINPIATFRADASNGFFNSKWRADYEGVSRANSVLATLNSLEEGVISDEERSNIAAQARFLRGHFYFDLKKMFNMVPWIDETTTDPRQPNKEDIWSKIEEDFKFAFEQLPETQPEVGRVNKWAAGAYLGKTYLYQKKYAEAKAIFDQVIADGQTSNGLAYDLPDIYYQTFYAEWKNHAGSVFAIQMVSNDGTNSIANANDGNMLNFPYNSPFRCCGFFQPTQDLVNSFKTNPATGLPYLEDYNSNPLRNDMGIPGSNKWSASEAYKKDDAVSRAQPGDPYTERVYRAKSDNTGSDPNTNPSVWELLWTEPSQEGSLDPRLDWTVGRRGVPYLDWGWHPGMTWVREQASGGPYAPKKYVYWQSTQGEYADQSSWAPGTANNVMIIRFADVLLMAAECEVEAGSLETARQYVNKVRQRAANTAGFVHEYVNENQPMGGFSNVPAANYKINPYPSFADQETARKAVRFERRLELGMEGHRFFDLVRWGIAEEVLNAFFDYEGTITNDVTGGSFTSNRNEYYPIPQAQIDISRVDGVPTLDQNPGY